MSGNLTVAELHDVANELCQQHWGVEYTGTIELVNRHWKRRAACFVYDYKIPLMMIRMSKLTNAGFTREKVTGYLLHELVHWKLCVDKKPFDDEDDGFIAECLRVGAPLSKTQKAKGAHNEYLQKRGYEERTGKCFETGKPLI